MIVDMLQPEHWSLGLTPPPPPRVSESLATATRLDYSKVVAGALL